MSQQPLIIVRPDATGATMGKASSRGCAYHSVLFLYNVDMQTPRAHQGDWFLDKCSFKYNSVMIGPVPFVKDKCVDAEKKYVTSALSHAFHALFTF